MQDKSSSPQDAQSIEERLAFLTRRSFIGRSAHGIGAIALGAMLGEQLFGGRRAHLECRADPARDGA